QMGHAIDEKTYSMTLHIFDKMLKLLHPFMPFITEELWQNLAERKDGDSLMMQLQPKEQEFSEKPLADFEQVKQLVTSIRNVRKEKKIANKEPLSLHVNGVFSSELLSIAERLTNISKSNDENSADENGVSFLVGVTEFFIPLGNLINVEEEQKKLETDLVYYQKFLATVLAKLNNEKFVNSAPESIVALERKKQSDAQTKIATIEEQLKKLE
ncbi:MAG: class I tRNA ligase family protein, partial [Bacteroidales bacterium]